MTTTKKFSPLLSEEEEKKYNEKLQQQKRGKNLVVWSIIGLIIIAAAVIKVASGLQQSPTESVLRIKQAFLVIMCIATIIAFVALSSGISDIKNAKRMSIH